MQLKLSKRDGLEFVGHLERAERSLRAVGSPAATALIDRLSKFSDTFTPADVDGVQKLVEDLVHDISEHLSKMRPTVALQNERMIPNAKLELPRAASDAIDHLGKAVDVVRRAEK